MSKKELIIGIVLIVIVAVATIIFVPRKMPINPPVQAVSIETLKTFPVFSQPLPGVTNIGFANFSPDGKYFVYSAFTNGVNPENQSRVVDLKTGMDKVLDGMLSRGFKDNNYLTLFKMNEGVFLSDINRAVETKLSVSENTRDVFVSPNEKLASTNGEGMVIINLETKNKNVFDPKPESMGLAWFSDSKRILGFKENEENLFDAGKGRDLGIWNAETGEFKKIPISFPVKSIRYIEWLKQDHIARVNAGYDDGSYDYLVNVNTNTMIDLGETSWALMGGIVTDQKMGIMAAIGSGGAGDCVTYNECDGFIADETGKIAEFTLPRDFHRSGLQIISKTKLLYIRRDLGEEGGYGTTKLVTYDTTTKTETVIHENIPNMNIVALSLSPDKKVWVAGAGDRFIVGEIN